MLRVKYDEPNLGPCERTTPLLGGKSMYGMPCPRHAARRQWHATEPPPSPALSQSILSEIVREKSNRAKPTLIAGG